MHKVQSRCKTSLNLIYIDGEIVNLFIDSGKAAAHSPSPVLLPFPGVTQDASGVRVKLFLKL